MDAYRGKDGGKGRGRGEDWGRGRGTGGEGGRGRGRGRGRGGGRDGVGGRGHHQQHQSSSQDRQPGRGGRTQMFPCDVNQGQGARPQFISHEEPSAARGPQAWGMRPPSVTGAGRGWGPSVPAIPSTPQIQAPIPRQNTSPDPVHDTPASQVEESNAIVPIMRPDNGGKSAVKTCKLRANHFLVNFSSNTIIRLYNVEVRPENPPKNGRPVKITKANLCVIRDKLFSDNKDKLRLTMTAYDGEKNIFSVTPLPTGTYKVTVNQGEDTRDRTYVCTIEFVNELKLSKLKDYLAGQVVAIPRDILHAMDVVFKENPARNMISVGKSFFSEDSAPNDYLGNGVVALQGSHHSLKTTMQGLALCLDYTVLAFFDKMPILDLLHEQIYGFDLRDFGKFRRDVDELLKGLKVTVTHRKTTQKFTIAGLTEKITKQLSFTAIDPDGQIEPRNVRVVDYFREKYGKEIKYIDIPCLNLGRVNKNNDVPMEFCIVAAGQRYPKEFLNNVAARNLKNKSVILPMEREGKIRSLVRSKDGPCVGEIVQNFGMDVNMNMTTLTGRIIGPPELKAGRNGRITVDSEKCQWNLLRKSVVEGKRIDCWAILDFSSRDRFRLNLDHFVPELMTKCKNLGIVMNEPFNCVSTTMNKLGSSDALLELLESINGEARQNNEKLQMVLCVMTKRDPGYERLKFLSETKVGIVTQCCLSSSKFNDQYYSNLALKINAKLGGSNVELIEQFPNLKNDRHVMFIGADVNHPGARSVDVPSITAVVATMNWPAANRYAGRVRAQDSRTEKILDFGEMCGELVESYARLNKARPSKIIVFRDGVSDGQFDMVLNKELVDMRRTFQAMNYHPTISLVVAQKRHQTRLFPESKGEGSMTGNVLPGTVVDTVIVNNSEFNFYLNSHYGSLGTSKPTHYYVLWDEHNFTSDSVQRLIYHLCFTFARCTKPVSLVPPVFYADLAAYRGRMYYNSAPTPTASSFPCFKLHDDLENYMFFV